MAILDGNSSNSSSSSSSLSAGNVIAHRSLQSAIEDMSSGSDLTHGSTVVLAGSMAAAMRRRRGKVGLSLL